MKMRGELTPEVLEEAHQVIRWREVEHWTFQKIANELGYANASGGRQRYFSSKWQVREKDAEHEHRLYDVWSRQWDNVESLKAAGFWPYPGPGGIDAFMTAREASWQKFKNDHQRKTCFEFSVKDFPNDDQAG